MKFFIHISILILFLLFFSTTVSAKPNFVPRAIFLLAATPSSEIDSSELYGAELQFNWRFESPFAVGFHGILQNQEYGDFDSGRWGLGVSLNYYLNLNSLQPYVGIKRTYYGGFGQSQEALDCLYCSDVEEDYSGGETFVTIGTIINRWTFQVDMRVSDEKSGWSESANDPWGVGQSYSDNFEGIPDPKYIFEVGYSW